MDATDWFWVTCGFLISSGMHRLGKYIFHGVKDTPVAPVTEDEVAVPGTTPEPGYRDNAKPKSEPVAGAIETVVKPKWMFRKYVNNGQYLKAETFLAERTADGKQWMSETGIMWYDVNTGATAKHDLNEEICGAFKVAQFLERKKNSTGHPIGSA